MGPLLLWNQRKEGWLTLGKAFPTPDLNFIYKSGEDAGEDDHGLWDQTSPCSKPLSTVSQMCDVDLFGHLFPYLQKEETIPTSYNYS